MATATSCPECHGAKEVHRSLYERRYIPVHRFKDENTWRGAQYASDGTCTVRAEAAQCRVCWGRGYL